MSNLEMQQINISNTSTINICEELQDIEKCINTYRKIYNDITNLQKEILFFDPRYKYIATHLSQVLEFIKKYFQTNQKNHKIVGEFLMGYVESLKDFIGTSYNIQKQCKINNEKITKDIFKKYKVSVKVDTYDMDIMNEVIKDLDLYYEYYFDGLDVYEDDCCIFSRKIIRKMFDFKIKENMDFPLILQALNHSCNCLHENIHFTDCLFYTNCTFATYFSEITDHYKYNTLKNSLENINKNLLNDACKKYIEKIYGYLPNTIFNFNNIHKLSDRILILDILNFYVEKQNELNKILSDYNFDEIKTKLYMLLEKKLQYISN